MTAAFDPLKEDRPTLLLLFVYTHTHLIDRDEFICFLPARSRPRFGCSLSCVYFGLVSLVFPSLRLSVGASLPVSFFSLMTYLCVYVYLHLSAFSFIFLSWSFV